MSNDRLTRRINGRAAVIDGYALDTIKGAQAVVGRLAAYEDTGLVPEQIIGMCEMDRRAKMADLLRLEEYQALGTVENLLAEKDREIERLKAKVEQWKQTSEENFASCGKLQAALTRAEAERDAANARAEYYREKADDEIRAKLAIVKELGAERDAARQDCAVAEGNHRKAVEERDAASNTKLELFFGRGELGVDTVAENEDSPLREILIRRLQSPVIPIGSILGDKGKTVDELENILVRMHFENVESALVLERALQIVLGSFVEPRRGAAGGGAGWLGTGKVACRPPDYTMTSTAQNAGNRRREKKRR